MITTRAPDGANKPLQSCIVVYQPKKNLNDHSPRSILAYQFKAYYYLQATRRFQKRIEVESFYAFQVHLGIWAPFEGLLVGGLLRSQGLAGAASQSAHIHSPECGANKALQNLF